MLALSRVNGAMTYSTRSAEPTKLSYQIVTICLVNAKNAEFLLISVTVVRDFGTLLATLLAKEISPAKWTTCEPVHTWSEKSGAFCRAQPMGDKR